jgi:hypothetical protein
MHSSVERQGISRDVNIRELARSKFVEGFADGYGLVKGTRHRAWELYIQWIESAWMREDVRYHREGKGYGTGFAAVMSARGDD